MIYIKSKRGATPLLVNLKPNNFSQFIRNCLEYAGRQWVAKYNRSAGAPIPLDLRCPWQRPLAGPLKSQISRILSCVIYCSLYSRPMWHPGEFSFQYAKLRLGYYTGDY